MPPALDAGGRLSLRVAPRFHDPIGPSARVAVSDGAECDGAAFAARGPFRAPTADELAALGGGTTDADPLSPRDLALFLLPRHLVEAWREVADAATDEGALPGFAAFADAVVELLRWKGVPLPEPARCEAIALGSDHRPGTSAVADAAAAAHGGPRLVASLGPQTVHAILLPLAGDAVARELAARGEPVEEVAAERSRRYLREVRDAPLLRVRLEPGDGLWLPPVDLLLDVAAGDPEDDAVVLSLRAG